MKNTTQTTEQTTVNFRDDYPVFTPEMKKTYTILIPDMLPWHFELLVHVMRQEGYTVDILKNEGRQVIDEGLKHVHNDACYPALCVIGQYLDALKSGKYDIDHTAVMITQSGGGCRASNYIPLIRKALKAEFPQVPVLSLNFAGLEKGNGLELSLGFLIRLAYAIFYGDLIMSFYNQTKPYEMQSGASAKARAACVSYIKQALDNGSYRRLRRNMDYLLNAFSSVPVTAEEKVKVGIVGEIYVKYSPLGNSHLEEFLLRENCEPVVPALMDFILYCIINNLNDVKFYEHRSKSTILFRIAYRYLYGIQKRIIRRTKAHGRFEPLHDFEHLRRCADKVINQGVKMGEGWLIPAEMAALAETGTDNIVCAQPFGCLPNHIAGKGAVRALKHLYPEENIVPIDYDPSATRVNQENRIKLMLATAREALSARRARPNFCEKCNRLERGNVCGLCGNKKLRKVTDEDMCYFITISQMSAGILEEAFRNRKIRAVFQPCYRNAPHTGTAGRADSRRVFVRYADWDAAYAVYRDLFLREEEAGQAE